MNKIYTYAIPVKKTDYITDARNPYDFIEVGEVEVYDGMTADELDSECRNVGIPDNAIVIATRLV